MNITKEIIFGKNTDHLFFDKKINRYFHKDIYHNFLDLKERAKKEGYDIYVISSFRSYNDQLKIWNSKISGEKQIYDINGKVLEIYNLSSKDLIFAILTWSALPGSSRHHWGTDLDIICNTSAPPDYQARLAPDEYEPSGYFYNLKKFIDKEVKKNNAIFFRPYEEYQGGISPEMWHISHCKVSNEIFKQLNLNMLKEFYDSLKNDPDFKLIDIVLDNLEEIYNRFIINVSNQSK